MNSPTETRRWVEQRLGACARETQQRCVQLDVLSAVRSGESDPTRAGGELAVHLHPFSGCESPHRNQQRALAGAVPADDCRTFAFIDTEGDIFEGVEMRSGSGGTSPE